MKFTQRKNHVAVRLLALALGLATVVAACGQDAEVAIADAEIRAVSGEAEAFGADDDGFGDPGDDGFETDGGDGFDDGLDGDGDGARGAGGGGETSGDGEARTAGDAGTRDGNGGTQASAQGSREPQGTDRTGVTDDKITIGVHAPVTGAAPLPSRSFEESRELYWDWLIDGQGQDVLGRTNVEVLFRDDRYDPSAARQVCRELGQRAFFLVGGGGTDQIQTCGQLAGQAEMPYFSAGVTEAGLRGNPWYFAASMSYKQQGPLLAQWVKSQYGDAKTAMVVTDTRNFDDAVEGWMAGVRQQGINYYDTIRHTRGSTDWYRRVATQLRDNDVEVVYVLFAPVDYIRFAQQAHEQEYYPQFVGVGVTMGLNPVLGSGCPQVHGGEFFSPFPGLDWARNNEPEFFTAVRDHGGVADDLSLALWGTAKSQHGLFQEYERIFGHDLTREDFRAVVSQASVESGVFPPVSYSSNDHFGAKSVHLLRADCDSGEHVTVRAFASGF